MNLPTILIGLAVLALFVAIVVSRVRARKKGAGGCGCGCDHCPSAGACHPGKR